MAQTFTVFLPNKMRYKLEISKTTPLYQGLEKVCTIKGYLPVHDYTFRYNKTYPDLSTPVGMLNLSNLSELELVPASEAPTKVSASSSSEDVISIGLQYGTQRHIECCNCDTSLWDIVCEFAEKHPNWIPSQPPQPDHHPVLLHLRQEVPGEAAMRVASPRRLGLRPGGPPALFRLLHRPVPPERLAEAAASLAPPPPSSCPATVAAAATATSNVATSSSIASSSSSAVVPQPQTRQDRQEIVVNQYAAQDEGQSLFSPFREVPRDQAPSRSAQPPARREPRTLAEALNLPDFESQQQQREATQPHSASIAQAFPPAQAPFGPDRPFRFPAETAGQDLYRNELAETVRPAEFAPCDRRLAAYVAGAPAATAAAATATTSGTETVGAGELEEPDESFFKLTESDLRRMMADLKRKVDEETNGQLLTRHQRELQREQFYSTYEYSVLRLFFPDKRVVQATFKPRETVFALYKFVRTELLANPEADFFLYTTPPKKEITDMAQFLVHADLVPMPIVYVGFRTPIIEGQAILKPEILALVSNRDDCDRKVLACMKSAVEPLYAKQQQQQQEQQEQQKRQQAASSGSSGGERAAHTVPKWFKK